MPPFCLIPNHYHMLVQTPEANISKSMRHLNKVYSQKYNIKGSRADPFITRRLRRDTLKEIGAQLGIDRDSTVSNVMERMKKKLAGDRKFFHQLNKITGSITKS